MSALTEPLEPSQLTLLKTMAGPYLESGQWPTWFYVQRIMDDEHADATGVLKSLPVVGSTDFTGPTYGLAWYDRNMIHDDSRPALTAASALHVPELQSVFGENFIIVLRYLIEKQRSARPSPDSAQPPHVTSNDFKADHDAASPEFLALLPGILQREPVMRRGYQGFGTQPTGWLCQLHRGFKGYRGVDSLRSYVDKVSEIIEADWRDSIWQYTGASNDNFVSPENFSEPEVPATVALVIDPPRYVNTDLIAELEAKDGQTALSPDKLLQLMRELNACYAEGHYYACHALVRAIIDHVAPIFGAKSFEAAAANYKWPTHTDKRYVGALLAFKNTADDVMHRQIRASRGVITLHDLPQGAALNAFLRLCVDIL